MDDKLAWLEFCRSAPPDLPVFFQNWFLDAVCEGGEWQVILARKNGRIIGGWPIFLKRKFGFRYVAMPRLCRLLGPYLLPEIRQSASQEMSVLKELIGRLPPDLMAFEQDFHYQNQNWLPFFWQKFRQTTRYSFQLSPLADPDFLWKNIAADYRNQKIGKAEKLVSLRTDLSPDEFWRIQKLSFSRQNEEVPLGFSPFKKLHDAAVLNGSGQLFFAVDSSENIHSAAFLIWDKSTSYLLMAGDDPQFRQSGAGIWLIWEMVKFSHNSLKVNTFDFLGSMNPNIERVRRQFGAEVRPYFRIQKEWSFAWRLAKFFLR